MLNGGGVGGDELDAWYMVYAYLYWIDKEEERRVATKEEDTGKSKPMQFYPQPSLPARLPA